jgi:ferrochelatase
MEQHPIGVILLAYGTPQSLDDVEPYYTHIRRGRRPSDEEVRDLKERYRQVGGKTPLLEIAQEIAAKLQRRLNGDDEGPYRVYVGMKHWHPFIEETVRVMAAEGVRSVIGLPIAPHYSRMSIGDYRQTLEKALRALPAPPPLRFVESWHGSPRFIAALAKRVQRALAEHFPGTNDVEVVFSAHSLPERILSWNDPYPEELRQSAAAVAQAAGLASWRLCYQSAGHTAEPWLGPDILDSLRQLAVEGRRRALSVPFGFVIDNLEILFDIDIEAQNVARELGMTLHRIETLNASDELVEALAEVVTTGNGARISEVALAGEDVQRAP